MNDIALETYYGPIRIKNPLVAASSGYTKNFDFCKRAQDAGFSAVVMKSVQEELIMRTNPNPRFEVIKDGIAGYSSTTFYCYEQAYEFDIDAYGNEIAKTKASLDIPVIASINCITQSSWAKYANICAQAGADAIEIVASCPSGMMMRTANDVNLWSSQAVSSVKRQVGSLPVGVKMTLQNTNPIQMALDLQAKGVDYLIMYNRFSGIDININTQAPIMHGGIAGHGGPWIKLLNMRWILATYPLIHVPISATGGVVRWEDVVKYLLCGASNVQIASLLYLKGYETIPKILSALENYVNEKGIEKLKDIIGVASTKIIDNQLLDRSKNYFASVDLEKCIQCKKCKHVCMYDALDYDENGPVINPDFCDGCNLCVTICPNKAISMIEKIVN